MNEASAARLELRSATLGAPAVHGSKLVEWNGKKFEVRLPTLKQQRFLKAQALDKKTQTQDDLKALVWGITECVYVPGTDERVFDAADFDDLMGRNTKDFIGTFMRALGELGKVDPEEAVKNSEGSPTESL